LFYISFFDISKDLTNELELTYTMISNNGTSLQHLQQQTEHNINYKSVISLVGEVISLIYIKILILYRDLLLLINQIYCLG
jgi:hypothetical protein